MQAPAGAAGNWASRPISSTSFAAGTSGFAQWWANDCGTSAPMVTAGSQGVIRENGTSGIVKLKVQYLLQVPNYTGGYRDVLSKTYESVTFPNNATSYTYTAPFHRFGAVRPADGLRLAIKFTWVRNNATDVNWTQAVAYC
jgi:hypothetical protein